MPRQIITTANAPSRVTARPTEDPADPLVILRDLPEREHEEFLRQYHQAVDAAHDPAGYRQLRRFLHVWSLTAIPLHSRATTRNCGRARGNGHDSAGHRRDPRLGRSTRRGQGTPVTYRAELSGRALGVRQITRTVRRRLTNPGVMLKA